MVGKEFLGLGCRRLERSLRIDVTSYRASSRAHPAETSVPMVPQIFLSAARSS